MDLKQEKWFKSEQETPDGFGNVGEWAHAYVVKHEDSLEMSLMDFQEKLHFKINVYDLLPVSLLRAKRNFHEVLVWGFIQRIENGQNMRHMPIVLRRLVLEYFPFMSH